MPYSGRDLQETSPRIKVLVGAISLPYPRLDSHTFVGTSINILHLFCWHCPHIPLWSFLIQPTHFSRYPSKALALATPYKLPQ